jgi:hypothetical protein
VQKSSLLESLRGNTLNAVHLELITADHTLPVTSNNVCDFSPIGEQTLQRACLAAVRRFCGNISEALEGRALVDTDLDLLAAILDGRTKGMAQLSAEDRPARNGTS